MAKMKIMDITKSLQQGQFPDVENKDVIKLLNDNGFEAKRANSSIEDAAIGFLMQQFKDPKNPPYKKGEDKKETAKKSAGKKDAPKKETAAGKAGAKSVSSPAKETQPVKEEKTAKAEKPQVQEGAVEKTAAKKEKTENAAPKKEATVKEQREETAQTEAEKSGKKETKEQNVSAGKSSRDSKDNRTNNKDNYGNRENRENRGGREGNNRSGFSGNRDSRGGRDNNNRGGFSGNRDSRGGKEGNNRGGFSGNRDSRGGRDNNNRGGFNGNRDSRGGREGNRGGRGVIDRFEKSQNSIDAIKPEVKASRQQRGNKNDSRSAKQRYGKDRRRGEMDEYEEFLQRKKRKDPNRKGAFIKPEPVAAPKEPEDGIRNIVLPEKMTIKELADKMKQAPAAVVKKLLLQGQIVSINHEITFEEAEEIALEYNCIAEMEEKVDVIAELLKEDEEAEENLVKRPPVVCVMGHVDHGKTSLLDAIRETHVTDKEAGGITQHIGAYMVEKEGQLITFLDTPGHEAFTSMRLRGAKSTDIAILVVAADDGVMPQTVEAIDHAKAAGIEIIVAINKIDKPSANIERVKQELVEHELIPEDWGGSTVFVPVSAHTGEGIDQLLEMILLTAEVCELKSNPDRKARGIVIEARLDKGRGPVATILVQKGTLRVGDNIAIGSAYGKVRAMMNANGERVKVAAPSTPVEIIGLHDVPEAGEIFMVTDTDKEARSISEIYIKQGRERLIDDTKSKLSLEGLFSQIQAGNIKELNIIVKADVQGSVEAVKQSLLKLSNEEVAVRIIHGGVGAVTVSDVTLASASNAIIIAFNVRTDNQARDIADREKVDLRQYKVIYDAINDVEAAMKGLQEPVYEEQVVGHAEIRQIFKASGVGNIAGSYVLDGKIVRGCKVRISREGEQIFEGELESLKRFKDDVKDVNAGYECGLVFKGFGDFLVEDQGEAYIMVEVPR